MSSASQTVLFEVSEGVATVVINRPEAMNAIDPETGRALAEVFGTIAADQQIHVVILTGAGTRAFSTGADLKKTAEIGGAYAATAFSATGDRGFQAALDCGKPVICAINGYALGGGLELALACDIRIAASHALLGLPEVKVGTIPGAGGTQRLPRVIRRSDAMLMLLTGEPVDAAEALRIGLVSRVVAGDTLRAEAEAIARRIAANAPLSVRAVKRLVAAGEAMPLDQAIAHERYAWGLLRETEDRAEGRRAFAGKRKPDFKGR